MKKLVSAILCIIMVLSVFGAFPVLTSAASMTDATFFAKFNYAANPGLSDVKTYVDAGDYDNAKAALLQYFKDRKENSTISGFGITEADEFYGMAVLPMRNILTGPYEFDMWQAEFTVTSSSYSTYEVDVTERIASQLNNGAVSFMLFAGDKQQYPVLVQSKEAGANVAPKLKITYEIDGEENTVTVTADQDTYISSGNTDTTYGSATELYIKEDGTGSDSTGSNTRRTYINFPLNDAANSTIISAELIVSACYASDCTTGDKDVLVINIGDTIWAEDSLTWAGVRGNIYSYQNASVPTWAASAPNADSEYHNVTSRFWFGKPMAYEYLSYLENPEFYDETHPYSDVYPGEDFGPKLVDLMDAFASQRAYGYTRTLETGERLNRWVDIIDAFLDTDVFDDRLDQFCNILSFMWGDCNYLAGLDIANGSHWWSNWRIVANAGFFKAVEYLPEFALHDTWRDKVEYNVEYTFDLLYNDDYSFTEAGPSYAAWCVKLFGDCIKAADMSGTPMSAVFKEKVKYATRNALESYYPDGYDSNIGDSNFRNQMHYFTMLNEVFNKSDNVINSYASGTDKGADYLTSYYQMVNSAYMRNSWDPEEAVYINYTNNPADGHYHPDSNQVLMYAYGAPLLVDSGRYSYSSTNSIYNTLRTAQSHNTVEADELTLGAHSASASANALSYSNTNDTFDFATSTQNGYSNVAHTRNVFFAKSGFGIVTDYVSGTTSRAYRQNWHFLPSSNAEANGTTVKTDFYNAPNITVSAASATTTSVKDGYHSADYGLVSASKYASFEKTGATVKFDTLLYPERADEEIEAYATDLASSDTSKAAIKITVDGEDSYYYVKNTSSSDGTFGSYSTDAKMAYVSDTEYMIVDGKEITGKIDSATTIVSMGVTIDEDGNVAINGESLKANSDTATAIAIYAPNASSVTLNGETVTFTKSGNYIYAVASTVAESVTGAIAKVYPDKDGFVASSSGNEGSSQTTIIQAARSWQNRNAYMAFDLSDFEDKEITAATLKMLPTEVANSPSNLHFYYLDYGTWTRSNLSFVLDSTKMPTHTNTSGGFTGYSYRWSGSVSSATVGNWVSLASNLPSYLAANDNYKFTWAILAEAGSIKFNSINAASANRPYLEVTYNYTSSSEADPTVTIKKYADGKLKSTTTDTATLGSIYLYEADDVITSDGTTYYIDADMSKISTYVTKDNNVIEVYYYSAKNITVEFSDILGNTISDDVTVSVNPSLTTYTYSAPSTIEADNCIYTLDPSASTLSCQVGQKDELFAVYKKTSIISENLIYNGDMSETTTSSGYTYVTGWQGGYVNGEHQALSNRPDIYLHSSKGAGSTTDSHFIYTAATATENAYVTTPARSAMTSSDWGTYPWKSDVSESYMAFVLTSWMRDANNVNNYLKAEKGKTYYMSFDMKATSIANVNNVVGFTAVSVNGDSYATKIPGTNGDINTLTRVMNNSIGRNRYLTKADEWVTVSTTATATADGYFMFQLGWAHEYGQVSVGNFKICEVEDFEYATVTLDGNSVITEGTIALGNETDKGFELPDNVIGYQITNGDNTRFVPAGETAVVNNDVITTTPINVKMVAGAQVRYGGGLDNNGKISSGNGLRFIAQVDRSYIGEEVTGYGMKVSAEDSEQYVDIPAATWQDGNAKTIFSAALTALSESNYNRNFTAVPYVNVKYADGSTATIYATEGITRSIYQVAVGLLKTSNNGLEDNNDDYGVENQYGLYDVLNAYVNMVGIRLTMNVDGSFEARTTGNGAYTGDIFFDVTSKKIGDGVYSVTVTPVTDNFENKVTILSYWNEFIRINNNHSVVIQNISNSEINDDGSVTFTFTVPATN